MEENKTNEKYSTVLENIKKIIPASFVEKANNSGVTFFGTEGTRLLKLAETKKGFKIEFNFEVKQVEGLTTLSVEEASNKHMGTCRWIYLGEDSSVAGELVEEAIKKYTPKKRSDSVKLPNDAASTKKDNKKDTSNKSNKDATNISNKRGKGKDYNPVNQSRTKNGPVIVSHLSPEELEKLNKK